MVAPGSPEFDARPSGDAPLEENEGGTAEEHRHPLQHAEEHGETETGEYLAVGDYPIYHSGSQAEALVTGIFASSIHGVDCQLFHARPTRPHFFFPLP